MEEHNIKMKLILKKQVYWDELFGDGFSSKRSWFLRLIRSTEPSTWATTSFSRMIMLHGTSV
jgi:hypothetical protein